MKNLILVIFFLSVFYQSASACLCEFSDKRFNEAKAVFYGQVLEQTRNQETRQVIIKVKLERVFKGDVNGIITILSPYVCSYNFEIGKRYLIYSGNEENSSLETGPCRILYDKIAKQEMKYLVKGKKPKNPMKYK